MKRFFLAVIFLIISITSSFAQNTLKDYKYIIVSEYVDFVNGKNKYQLGSMAKFYLDKMGFTIYLESNAPSISNCEVAYATIVKEKSFIKNKLFIRFNDCKKNILYNSPVGVSSLKDWKKSYQDALRKSLIEMDTLIDVNTAISSEQTGIKTTDTLNVTVIKKEIKNIPNKKVVTQVKVVAQNDNNDTKVTTTVTNAKDPKTTQVVEVTGPLPLVSGPTTKFSSYSFKGMVFLLRKTTQGFSFYKEVETDTGLELQGQILLEDNNYILNTENKKLDVLFTKNSMKIFKTNNIEVYNLKN